MTSTTAATSPTARTLRATWTTTAGAAVVALAINLAGNQALHAHKPSEGGWSEAPFYVVTALIAWGIACLGLWRARRASAASVSLVFGILGVLLAPVAYYTALPFTWGATAFLLARDATPGRRPPPRPSWGVSRCSSSSPTSSPGSPDSPGRPERICDSDPTEPRGTA